jgi:hypothetical protein
MMINEFSYTGTKKAYGIMRHSYIIDISCLSLHAITIGKVIKKTTKEGTFYLDECWHGKFRFFKFRKKVSISFSCGEKMDSLEVVNIRIINQIFNVRLILAHIRDGGPRMFDHFVGVDIQDVKLPENLRFFGCSIKSKERESASNPGESLMPNGDPVYILSWFRKKWPLKTSEDPIPHETPSIYKPSVVHCLDTAEIDDDDLEF